MTCFHPQQGYEREGMTDAGKFGFTMKPAYARRVNGELVRRTVSCRKCVGCRNDYAKEWATKITHEASVYFDGSAFRNSFITLTYNDDFIPAYGALDYARHWTNFLKRLRQAVPNPIRFYMIGEYGDLNLRPHYHAIIFGYDFPDKSFFMQRGGELLYRSPLLESLWTVPRGLPNAGASLGYTSIGDVTFASAAYVARYSMKKIIGTDPDEFGRTYDPVTGEINFGRYIRINPETGEKVQVPRERALMSNGGGSGEGGIGKRWFELYHSSLYAKDHTHTPNGIIVRPPKYYDKLLERLYPDKLIDIKAARQQHMATNALEFTPERLAAREEVFKRRLESFKRSIGSVYDR